MESIGNKWGEKKKKNSYHNIFIFLSCYREVNGPWWNFYVKKGKELPCICHEKSGI